MIIKQLETGYLDNFCYLLGCESTRKALVIDPGTDVERILSVADKEGLEIVTIVNTHAHGDHTAGNAELQSLTGANIIIHALDADGYPEADILIIDEETFQFGDITFDVIHTPGHTPGGICLYAQGNLFTGDTLFVGDSGRTDLPGGDHRLLISSIKEKLLILPDNTRVCPGHGPMTTIGDEKAHNPFLS